MDASAFSGGEISYDALTAYYQRFGTRMLDFCAGYPLTLKRFPQGAQGDYFFVHRRSQLPEALQARVAPREDDRIMCQTLDVILAMVSQGFWTFYMGLRPLEPPTPPQLPLWVGWRLRVARPEDRQYALRAASRLSDALVACGQARVLIKPVAPDGLDVMTAIPHPLESPEAQVWADTLAMALVDETSHCRWTEAIPDEAMRKPRTVYVSTACNASEAGAGAGLIAPWSLCEPLSGAIAIPFSPNHLKRLSGE